MDKRLFFSATDRNTAPIEAVLSRYLPTNGKILELASGSGQHAVHFQMCFPGLTWYASDSNLVHIKSIESWIAHHGLGSKMPRPSQIDVLDRPWNLPQDLSRDLCGIICINMIHVSPWLATKSLFLEARRILKKGSQIMIYGPFKINSKHTSESNEKFDYSLTQMNPDWGIRNLEDILNESEKNNFEVLEIIKMPANNLMIIFSGK